MFEKIIEEGSSYYSLTTLGYAAVASVAVLIVVAVALARGRKKPEKSSRADSSDPAGKSKSTSLSSSDKSGKAAAKKLAFCGVMLALGFVLSFIKILRLPWGGAVTLFSMLFICLSGYLYGLKTGLAVAFSYSLLQFMQGGGSYILSPLQICFDYLFAFTSLGLSGLFVSKKNGLTIGYIVSILARGLFHAIGGYMFWMDYMPESFPKSISFLYPFAYNYAYILLEGLLTVIILSIPAVKNGLAQVKRMAV